MTHLTRHRVLIALAVGLLVPRFASDADAAPTTDVSDAEWRRRLSPEAYDVLRRHGTERPGSSPLEEEHRHGTYLCAACAHPLFASTTKFESGSGWPSFYEPLHGAVATTTDRSMFMTRTEVHCAQCGGHLGHVFDDGPKPTGLRYCMNGVAMSFKPDAHGHS